MENLSVLRKRRSLALLLAVAVLMTYSLPLSIFADTGGVEVRQKKAEVVNPGGSYVYDENGDKLEGKDFNDDKAKIELSKKIVREPKSDNQPDSNQFDVELKVRTKSPVSVVDESEDAAVLLVVDLSNSMEWKTSKADPRKRETVVKEEIRTFLDRYAASANGKKREVAIIKFYTDALVEQEWIDVANKDNLTKLKSTVENMKRTNAKDGRPSNFGVTPNPIGGKRSPNYVIGCTNLEGALDLAKDWVNHTKISDIKNKHVIMLTDGEPSASTSKVMDTKKPRHFVGGEFISEDFIPKTNADIASMGYFTAEANVDGIPGAMEVLNGHAKTHAILFSDEMEGKIDIWQNKAFNVNDVLEVSRYLQDKRKNGAVDNLIKEYHDQQKILHAAAYGRPELPPLAVWLDIGLNPTTNSKASFPWLSWRTTNKTYMSGIEKTDWYKKYAKFGTVELCVTGDRLKSVYDSLNKKVTKVLTEGNKELVAEDMMGNYIKYVEGIASKEAKKYGAKYKITPKFKKEENVDKSITTYTFTYTVELDTAKEGFKEAKESAKETGDRSVDEANGVYEVNDHASIPYNGKKLEFPKPYVRGYIPDVPYQVIYHFIDRTGKEVESSRISTTPTYVKSGTTIKLAEIKGEEDYATKYNGERNGKWYKWDRADTEGVVLLYKPKIDPLTGKPEEQKPYELNVYYVEKPVTVNVNHYFIGTVIDKQGKQVQYTEENPYSDKKLEYENVKNNSEVLTPASENYYRGDTVEAREMPEFFSSVADNVKFSQATIDNKTSSSTSKKLENENTTINMYYTGTIDLRDKTSLEVYAVFKDYEWRFDPQKDTFEEVLVSESEPYLRVDQKEVALNGNSGKWDVSRSVLLGKQKDKKDSQDGYEYKEYKRNDGSGLPVKENEADTDGKPKSFNIEVGKRSQDDPNKVTFYFERRGAEPEKVQVEVTHKYHYTYQELDGKKPVTKTLHFDGDTVKETKYLGTKFTPQLVMEHSEQKTDGKVKYEYRDGQPKTVTLDLETVGAGKVYRVEFHYYKSKELIPTSVKVFKHYGTIKVEKGVVEEEVSGEVGEDGIEVKKTKTKEVELGTTLENVFVEGGTPIESMVEGGETIKLYEGIYYTVTDYKGKEGYTIVTKEAFEKTPPVSTIEGYAPNSDELTIKLKKEPKDNEIHLYYLKTEEDVKQGSIEVTHQYFTRTYTDKKGNYEDTFTKPLTRDKKKDHFYSKPIGEEFTATKFPTYKGEEYETVLTDEKELTTKVEKGKKFINIKYMRTIPYVEPEKEANLNVLHKYWKKVMRFNTETQSIETELKAEGTEDGTEQTTIQRVADKVKEKFASIVATAKQLFVGDEATVTENIMHVPEGDHVTADEKAKAQKYDPVNNQVITDKNGVELKGNIYSKVLGEGDNYIELNYTRMGNELKEAKADVVHNFYEIHIDKNGTKSEPKQIAKDISKKLKKTYPIDKTKLYVGQILPKEQGYFGGFDGDTEDKANGKKPTELFVNGIEQKTSSKGLEIESDMSLTAQLLEETTVDEDGVPTMHIVYNHYKLTDERNATIKINYHLVEYDWKGNVKKDNPNVRYDKEGYHDITIDNDPGTEKVAVGTTRSIIDYTVPKYGYTFDKGTHKPGKPDSYGKVPEFVTVREGNNVVDIYYSIRDKYGKPVDEKSGVIVVHRYVRRDLSGIVEDQKTETTQVVTGLENGIWIDNEFDGKKYKKLHNELDPEHADSYIYDEYGKNPQIERLEGDVEKLTIKNIPTLYERHEDKDGNTSVTRKGNVVTLYYIATYDSKKNIAVNIEHHYYDKQKDGSKTENTSLRKLYTSSFGDNSHGTWSEAEKTYIAKAYNEPGYKKVTPSTNMFRNYKKGKPVTIVVEYEKPAVIDVVPPVEAPKKDVITVEWKEIDKDGKVITDIKPAEKLTGKKDDPYTTAPYNNTDYVFVKVEKDGKKVEPNNNEPVKGKHGDGTKTVSYYYQKKNPNGPKPGENTVTVEYKLLDKDGKVINENLIPAVNIYGKPGTEFKTTPYTNTDYKIVKVEVDDKKVSDKNDPITGKIEDKDKKIVYFYVKVDKPTTPSNGGGGRKPEPSPNPSPNPGPGPNPPVNIFNPPVPLTNIPVKTIADTPVPLANKIVELIDEGVPLGSLPNTGGYGVMAVMGFGGLLVLAGVALNLGRKKDEQ